jgi:hypothetical protein
MFSYKGLGKAPRTKMVGCRASRGRAIAALSLLTVTGCANGLVMTARDSGQVYPATMRLGIHGKATVFAEVSGERFAGPLSRGGAQFGIVRRFGIDKPAADSSQLSSSSEVKGSALLSAASGHVLRCEFGNLPHAPRITGTLRIAGICLDDAERVYDIR